MLLYDFFKVLFSLWVVLFLCYFYVVVILPFSRNHLSCWIYNFAFPIHLIALKFTNVSLLLVAPQKTSFSVEFIVSKVSFICPNSGFKKTLPFFFIFHVITLEYHLPVLINDSLTFNHSFLEPSFIDHPIVPNISTIALPLPILKTSFIFGSIIVLFRCSSFRISIPPVPFILHCFIIIAQSSISIESWILELSFIIRTIKKYINPSWRFGFTVHKIPHIHFSLFKAAHSIPIW